MASYVSIEIADLGAILKENKVVQAVCESNAITDEQFINRNGDITKLEMCHNTLAKLENLQPFLSLKELCIVNQPINMIENLDRLPHLESLWICECKIEEIIGLDRCTKLKNVYLYSNKLERIQNLENLTQLEVLWLGDNKLTSLEGLSTLVNLKNLWVQSNQITSIGSTLENNTKLKELSIQDIASIAKLAQLEVVWFSDTSFGDNPMCQLANYQTHALSHLKQLTKLDGAPISEENRKLADGTYAKKKMYYNMKLKSLKRTVNGQIKIASGHLDDSCRSLHELDLPARKEIAKLEKIREERKLNLTRLDEPEELKELPLDIVEKKIEQVSGFLQKHASQFKRLENKFNEFEQAMKKYLESDYSRVYMELDSGGNIRLELGSPSDSWFTSCVELTTSRFYSESTFPFNVKVSRVYRIHNRHLRSQFENAYMNQDEDDDEDSDDEAETTKQVEFLFYSDAQTTDDSSIGNIDNIIESGFPTPLDYKKHNLGESVPLSNCINLAEETKLKSGANQNSLPTGKILIVKSLIGKNSHVKYDQSADATPSPSKSDYPNLACVFRTRTEYMKQKNWFFFDNVVLLPEYLVEVEYVPKSAPVEPAAEDSEESEDSKLMNKFTKECSMIVQQAQSISKDTFEPIASQHLQIPIITDDWLRAVHPPGAAFSSITYLNISGVGLSRLEGFALLVNLQVLVASHNAIRKMEGLNDLKQLEKLDLSNNYIRRIEGIKGLPLRSLLLHTNSLTRLDDVIVLKKYAPDLTELDMRNNPVCRARGYKVLVLRRLPKLTALDGVSIDGEEKSSAKEGAPTITPNFIRQRSYSRRNASLQSFTEGVESEDWWTKVRVLNLQRCGIRRISHLDKLVNLRKADISDNLIGRIDGLEGLKQLEDLSLEGNCISRVDGLSKLVNLRKLDLGRNQLTTAEGLETLVNLAQLSLEDNLIASLNGIQTLTNLMELYLGNNKISDRREIKYLRTLERLVILDLSGNEMDSTESYRLFVVHKLRHLKVLDGQVIEGKEQNASKERFAGRLTSDVLEESVGHVNYSVVRTLDLGNMKLREIDPLNGEEFTQLRELTLDHNSLTTAKGLLRLSSLEVLRLNHNRIEDLGTLDEETEKLLTLPRLEVLELSRNCVSSLTNLRLKAFPSLKILILTENLITRLEGLEGLHNLQKLVLDKNKIKSVDESMLNVANLPQLCILQLEENFLKNSACFSSLPQLRVLTLGQNRITDISELDRLILPRLEELTLAGNAVARKLHYRAHAIASNRTMKVLDGKPVTEEERNKAEYLVSTGVVQSGVVLDKNATSADAPSPGPTQKVAIKPNMIDFGQLLALGVKMDEPDRGGSPTAPKEWNALPSKPSPTAAKAWKSKTQQQQKTSAWK